MKKKKKGIRLILILRATVKLMVIRQYLVSLQWNGGAPICNVLNYSWTLSFVCKLCVTKISLLIYPLHINYPHCLVDK